MTNPLFFSLARSALITVALGSQVPATNAQPAAPVPAMPADIVKPMPTTGVEMRQGMDTKPSTDMKQGMDMKPMMMDMQEKMSSMKSGGNTDVDFAMMMRVHHQSAISMAEAELKNGQDPQMRVMAKGIIRAQKKEIAAFDKFLAKHGEPGRKMDSPALQMKK